MIDDVKQPRDPISVRWWMLLAIVIFTTAGSAVGWAIASRSLSSAEAKVEAAVVDAGRARSAEAMVRDCADFADDKTRDEFISHGGPAKGCEMGFASRDRSRELVSNAHADAERADVTAELVQRNVTAAGGLVDQWVFGIGLAATMGLAVLAIAPRRSPQPPQPLQAPHEVDGGS
jgi:hypothetical protein